MPLPTDARRLTRLALMTALGLVLQYVESLLPPLIPSLPIRIGLCNVVILYVLLHEGRRAACIVSALRLLLFALVMGQLSQLLFSLCGAALSLLGMCLLYAPMQKRRVTLFGVSAAGAFLFNMGQLLAALLVVGSPVLLYAPWLGLLSVPCGLITALLALCIPKW